jgi:hypothetical protein
MPRAPAVLAALLASALLPGLGSAAPDGCAPTEQGASCHWERTVLVGPGAQQLSGSCAVACERFALDLPGPAWVKAVLHVAGTVPAQAAQDMDLLLEDRAGRVLTRADGDGAQPVRVLDLLLRPADDAPYRLSVAYGGDAGATYALDAELRWASSADLAAVDAPLPAPLVPDATGDAADATGATTDGLDLTAGWLTRADERHLLVAAQVVALAPPASTLAGQRAIELAFRIHDVGYQALLVLEAGKAPVAVLRASTLKEGELGVSTAGPAYTGVTADRDAAARTIRWLVPLAALGDPAPGTTLDNIALATCEGAAQSAYPEPSCADAMRYRTSPGDYAVSPVPYVLEAWPRLPLPLAEPLAPTGTPGLAPRVPAAAGPPQEQGPWPSVAFLAALLATGAVVRAVLRRRDRAAPPEPRIEPGRVVLGKYRVLRLVGEGSFGRVFLARDIGVDRLVVLKEMQPAWRLDADAQAAFLREARVAGSLGHPNIVTVHGVEQFGRHRVVVMEYVEGGSLEDRLRAQGPLRGADALRVADGVLAALVPLHARGVQHRDLKPSNILLQADGTPKVADFGVAHAPDPARTLLAAHGQPGSLETMSPEQARGEPVDARCDLYSIAAVLYRMLAGKHYLPFEGASPDAARAAILHEPPRLPLAGAPREVNQLLAKGLAKRREERFATAAEMRAAVRAALRACEAPRPAAQQRARARGAPFPS